MPAQPRRSKNWVATITFVVILIITGIAAFAKLGFFPEAGPAGSSLTLPTPNITVSFDQQNNFPPSELPGWLTIYFTNPSPPDVLNGGVDQYVIPVIAAANSTIDVTSFDLNLPGLINALVDANKRGVKVRVVYDGVNGNLELENEATNNQPFEAIRVLAAAKVRLVDGGRENGLMHNKMIIVDGKTLFTGSMNLSYNDVYRNNNNLLKITEPRIIANYQAKFNEMFEQQKFGSQAEVTTPYPSFTLDGIRVENYFAPQDQVMSRLIGYVQHAQKSIHYLIFTYTAEDLANAMINRAIAGVEVQGVIDSRAAMQGVLPQIFCAKLPVKMDGNRYTMHHKVIIIDGQMVVTGSFNFTRSADTINDDNVIIFHSPVVAQQYEQEFQRIYSAGKTPAAADISCK